MLSTRSHVADHGFPHDVSMNDGLSAFQIYRGDNKTKQPSLFLVFCKRRLNVLPGKRFFQWRFTSSTLTVRLLLGASPYGLQAK